MYEVFDHTADLGLRITAPDVNRLFAEAGRAFYSVIVANLDDVEPSTRVEFKIAGDELAYLLVDWLQELLFTFESRRLLLSRFDATVDSGGLTAVAHGESLDESRHQLEHEVKAITYHGLVVEQVDSIWKAEVILDI